MILNCLKNGEVYQKGMATDLEDFAEPLALREQ